MTESNKLPQQVVVLTHEFYPKRGGIATHVEEVAAALVELGVQVTVWAPAAHEPHSDEVIRNRFPFKVRPLRVRGTQHWRSRLKLAWYLLSDRWAWQNSVVYLPEPGPIRAWLYLQLFERLLPSKLVITLHGSEIEYLSRFPHRSILFRRLLHNADRIGVVSRYVKESLLSRYPNTEHKLVLSYGAVRAQAAPSVEMPDASKRETERSNGRWTILTVARIHPRKGQLAVVEALGQLPIPVRDRISYRVVGPIVRSAYKETIAARANALGVQVEFTGELTEAELQTEYLQADAFVMASVRSRSSVEGFGLVYLEAGLYGLPVIAHDTGGVRDAVNDGVTGILVPSDDQQALEEAIRRLFESPKLCQSLGEAGRLHALSFSWARAARELFSGL